MQKQCPADRILGPLGTEPTTKRIQDTFCQEAILTTGARIEQVGAANLKNKESVIRQSSGLRSREGIRRINGICCGVRAASGAELHHRVSGRPTLSTGSPAIGWPGGGWHRSHSCSVGASSCNKLPPKVKLPESSGPIAARSGETHGHRPHENKCGNVSHSDWSRGKSRPQPARRPAWGSGPGRRLTWPGEPGPKGHRPWEGCPRECDRGAGHRAF
jgi:hypothetical protein